MKKTLLVAFVLLGLALPAAHGAWSPLRDAQAGVPDPANSIIPATIYVVTPVDGLPDIDGANGIPNPGVGTSNVIVLRDFANNPRPGVGVRIHFPCDIVLCPVSPGPPYTTTWSQTVNCDETGCSLHLVTDANGRAEFVALGAARDPGGPGVGGGGFLSTIVTVDDYVGTYKVITAAVLDQNGATGSGAGVSALDASIVMAIFLNGTFLYGTNQIGRADLNADGRVSALDAYFALGHYLRLSGRNTAGCAGQMTPQAPCP